MVKSDYVYDELYKKITDGNHKPGDKLPSEKALCAQFGVSRPTISKVLLRLKKMEVIYSKKGAGHFISSSAAQKITYAILAPRMEQDDSRYILDELFCLIQGISSKNRITLLRGRMHFKNDNIHNVIETIKSTVDEYSKEMVVGVFYVPIEFVSESELINKIILNYLSQLNIKVILLDRDYVPPPLAGDFDVIMMNNISAGYYMTNHLLHSGTNRIAFLMLKDSAMTITSRLYGFNIATQEYLSIARSSVVIKTKKINTETIDTLRLNNINHVVCANDFTAKCLIDQWRTHNQKIPLYTVSFDDASFSDDVSYSLTTWKHPLNEMAITAIELMNERISNPLTPVRVILLNGSMRKRKSCGL